MTRAQVDDEDVDATGRRAARDGILWPYDDLPAPVVVTVWDRQLHLEGADDPRLALFLEEYGDSHTAPEPMASCEGGVCRRRQPFFTVGA